MKRGFFCAILAALTLAPAAWAAEACCSAAGGESIPLFNGKDFEGWKLFVPDESVDVTKVWTVKDGVIHCSGSPAGYMRTTAKRGNYKLSWEWRWVDKGGNSGCLLHIQDKDEVWPKSIECQLMHENAADFWVIGGADFKEHVNKEDRRVPKKNPHNEKPSGEWNQGVAICDGDTISVYINGLLQNQATGATLTEGYIGFQSEGAPIEFRNIVIQPITKADEAGKAQ